jgi:hypothetical protein
MLTHQVRKAYREVEVKLHSFLTSTLYEGEWSASSCIRFASGGNAPKYVLDGPQNQFGLFGIPPAGNSTPVIWRVESEVIEIFATIH